MGREQAMSALAKANANRLGRAKVKRDVGSGELIAADVLVDTPECCRTMTVAELLASQRRWGPSRTSKLCADLAVPETKTLESLTLRQRSVLAVALPDGADAFVRLERMHRRERGFGSRPCTRLNGSGPCVAGMERHPGTCVIAVHAPALGLVYFRAALTNDLLRTVEVPMGGRALSPGELMQAYAMACEQSHEPVERVP
jgi:hypothetical protein